MNKTALVFIVTAAGFSVWGDYYLKRYGDGRRGLDLALCLFIWELCAFAWVLAYRQRVPLGASTVLGQALVVTTNVIVGSLVFGEQLTAKQALGAAYALVGILLVGS